MAKNIFLSKEISKLTKANKKEIYLFLELVTYLFAKNEISLQEAERYSNKLFSLLEKPKE